MRKRYKKLQKEINAKVRSANKSLINDELWKGRFVIRQSSINFINYEDNSGLFAIVSMRFIDKQTGLEKRYTTDYFSDKISFGYWLFNHMNDFIVKDVKVWNENPTREITKDYRKVEVN